MGSTWALAIHDAIVMTVNLLMAQPVSLQLRVFRHRIHVTCTTEAAAVAAMAMQMFA